MFKTKRCDLKLLKRSHYHEFKSIQTNELVRKYLGGITDKAEIKNKFEAKLNTNSSISWIITEKTSGEFIGIITLDKFNGDINTELSYTMLPDWWGKGFAHEATKCILKHAFDELNLEKIYAQTQTANIKSRSLLERLGMRKIDTCISFNEEQTIYILKRA